MLKGRFGGRQRVLVPKTTLWKAIRLMCLDCSANQAYEVLRCSVLDCPLYPYRRGIKGIKEAALTRMEVSNGKIRAAF